MNQHQADQDGHGSGETTPSWAGIGTLAAALDPTAQTPKTDSPMTTPSPSAPADLSGVLPVVLGGDIGAYAILRAFHEAYGVRGVAVVSVPSGPFTDTRIATLRVEPGLADADRLVRALVDLAQESPSRTRVLLTNADWFVRTLIERRTELDPYYLMPLCDQATFEAVSDKTSFAALCERLEIPTPRTVSVDVAALADGAAVRALPLDLPYPIVGKPASSADYHYVEFPGKAKIHHLRTRAEVDTLLEALRAAGYRGRFLLQEFVPGDETAMGSLTAYRDSGGRVTLLATGRVLLEEHAPDTLGIPAAILTQTYPEAMDAAARFLNAADYVGFANFDFKRDPRNGADVFFEVNPRIGRNNYYVTAAGANIAERVVGDLVEHRRLEPVRTTDRVLYTVVPVRLLLRYLLDAALRSQVRKTIRTGAVVHPLRYAADGSIRRRATITAVTLNFVRKYRRYYPRPTSDGL